MRKASGKGSRKVLQGFAVGSVFVIGTGGVALGLAAAKYQEKLPPNTRVGIVPVGDMLPDDAQKRVRIWWEGEKTKPIKLKCSLISEEIEPITLSKLGITVDDVESIKQVGTKGFWDQTKEKVTGEQPQEQKFAIKYKRVPVDLEPLHKKLKAELPTARPASVAFKGGQILLTKEIAGPDVDVSQLPDLALQALAEGKSEIQIPTKEGAKHVPDEELAKIKEVVSPYTTHFNAGQASRSNNIAVAASKLNGVVLMPGEQVSFNKTVGRRTIESGFKEAPVYKNGKHDKGIGGGICQVSSTLFNAGLFANLKVVQRHNHSLPVAYLPLGRDATVDYGSLDMVLENNYESPIGIVSEYKAGTLTFRILGTKQPGLSVKVIQTGHKTWTHGVEYVTDHSLSPGRSSVIEKGSSGHSCVTYRLVYRNGVLAEKENIGTSYYKGGPRIIARNGSPAPRKPASTSGALAPAGTAIPPTRPVPSLSGPGSTGTGRPQE